MTDYRRYFIPGGTYFFTVTLADRSSSLLTENIAALRAAFRHVRAEMPFVIDAIVVLPDHLHTIWILPPGRLGFLHALEENQGCLLSSATQDRASLTESNSERRARHLAASLLGARAAR